jgi:hypothetical protein
MAINKVKKVPYHFPLLFFDVAGSGIQNRGISESGKISGSGIRDKLTGSATLIQSLVNRE